MIQWITANLATILVAAVTFGLIAAVFIKLIMDKRRHKSSCSCGCAGCPSAAACHSGKARP